MTEKLRLPDVTICAADSAFVDLTVRALMRSMDLCAFGDAILFSDVARAGPFRHVPIAPLRSIADYSRFVLRDLVDHVTTSHILVVQWDGYVVDPAAWKRAFLKYDYIGSVWLDQPEHLSVGNGGFSLRSRRLMQTVRQLPHLAGYNEDVVIGRTYRAIMERDNGIRFAPSKIAGLFAHEYKIEAGVPTFGFHGVENLSRYTTDDELTDICKALDMARLHPEKMLILAATCSGDGHPKAAEVVYRGLRKLRSPIIIHRVLVDQLGHVAGDQVFHNLEAMVGAEPRPLAT
ncbi:MAG TPA: DUF5672 family protein [Bauldia sp.]|nr:DUF5672 family protein [Bauldia sp.]